MSSLTWKKVELSPIEQQMVARGRRIAKHGHGDLHIQYRPARANEEGRLVSVHIFGGEGDIGTMSRDLPTDLG